MKLKWKQTTGLIFALPAVVYFLLFFIFPFCYALFLGFQDYDLLSKPEFIGLANYSKMISNPSFRNSMGVTFYYTFGASIPICIFALLFALLFKNNFRGKYIYLTIFMMTCLMGLIPSTMAWKVLLHQDYGLFNKIFFYSWGFADKLNWLGNPNLAMPAMIIVSLSTGIPYYAIYLIGAVSGIPKEHYEVAKIEGANFFQRLRFIILPAIKNVYIFVIITATISAFQYMGPFYVMTRGGPLDSTRVISLFIFNNAFDFQRFGYASAMTIVILIILIPIVFGVLRRGGESD